MTKTFKRKTLRSCEHVVIPGNLHLSGVTCVGGNLTVDGDLISTGSVFCLGRLVVRGEMRAEEVIAGLGLKVDGDLVASIVRAYGGAGQRVEFDKVAYQIAIRMPGAARSDKYIDDALTRIVDPAVLAELEQQQKYTTEVVKVGGDCTVGVDPPPLCGFFARGDVNIKGHFNPDDATIEGHLQVGSAFVEEGDLECHQTVSAFWRLVVRGSLHCTELQCGQIDADGTISVVGEVVVTGVIAPARLGETVEIGPDLVCSALKAESVQVAGDVSVDGPIDCERYLRADGSIIAAGPITTGKKFGVLAGLAVPRDQWLATGYVCAPTRPANILTGKYRELSRPRRSDTAPRPVRIPRAA